MAVDRSDAADARRFRWMIAGHGYFLEEQGLCNIYASEEEQDEAREQIDLAMNESK